jgi:hypothetical protein
MAKVTMKDIVWGGRIKQAWQSKIWAIAQEVAIDSETSYSGGMLSSLQTTYLWFLDGGVTNTRGVFDSRCGMRFRGEQAQAYVLYRLGLNAKQLMKGCDLPHFSEMEKLLPKAGRRKQSSARRKGR